MIERGSASELKEVVGDLHRAADPELPDEDFVRALGDLQESLARISGNRILLLLSNSLERFLAQDGFLTASAIVAHDRQPVLSLLRRLAVALEARDVERAQGAFTEILRRVTRATLKGLEAPGASA